MKALQRTKFQYIYQADNGVFYIRIERKDRKLFKSLKTDKISEARIKADRLVQDFLGVKKTNGRALVLDFWDQFLAMNETKAPATYRSMEVQGRKHLMPFFGEMFLDQVTEADWEKYIARAKKLTPGRKLFNDRKCFAMMFVQAMNQGLIQRRPKFRNPDPMIKAGRVYSDTEVGSLIGAAGQDLKLMITMALTMGMRRGEILGLTWDRVDLKHGYITLRAEDTKIRKPREFAISDSCLTALIARRRNAKSDWVFPSRSDQNKPQGDFRKVWATCKKRAEVRGRFHDLRHTFLTLAFKESANPALICEYAGLSMDVAQKTYLHFTREDTKIISTLVGAP
jgi:integrase